MMVGALGFLKSISQQGQLYEYSDMGSVPDLTNKIWLLVEIQ